MSTKEQCNFISGLDIHYEIDCYLGAGRFGTVYKCKQIQFQSIKEEERIVAVKLVEFTRENEEKATREVELLRNLNHPHIIKIFKSWIEFPPKCHEYRHRAPLQEKSEGVIFIETEFCNLDSLRHWFMKSWRNRDHAKIFLHQITAGVKYLHDREIIHRDLKPENILLRNESNSIVAKICDFGISREIVSTMTSESGTYGYMSPEVLKGRKYNKKADIYALGVIFYEMLVLGDSRNAELTCAMTEMMLNEQTDYTFLFLPEGDILITPKEKSLIEQMVAPKADNRPNPTDIMHELCELYPYTNNLKIIASGQNIGHITSVLEIPDRKGEIRKKINHSMAEKIYSFQNICKNRYAVNTLNVISFLPPENINTIFVVQILEKLYPLSLFKKLFSFDDKLDVFNILEKHSMCERKKVKHRFFIAVDSILQEVIQMKLEEEGKLIEMLEKILDVFNKLLKANEVSSSNLIYVEAVWRQAIKRKELVQKYNNLLSRIALQYAQSGKYKKGLDFCKRALEDLQSLYGIENRLELKMMSWMGVFHEYFEEYEDALRIQLKVYNKQKSKFGEEDSHTLQTAKEIGTVFRKLKNLVEAKKWLGEAVEKSEAKHGNENRNTLSLKHSFALVLIDEEKYDEADFLLQEILLPLHEKVCGKEHPNTLTVKNDIAYCKECKEEYVEALKIYKEVLDKREKVLGKKHPDTLITKTNIHIITKVKHKSKLV